jgi:hypothetical protein
MWLALWRCVCLSTETEYKKSMEYFTLLKEMFNHFINVSFDPILEKQ